MILNTGRINFAVIDVVQKEILHHQSLDNLDGFVSSSGSSRPTIRASQSQRTLPTWP